MVHQFAMFKIKNMQNCKNFIRKWVVIIEVELCIKFITGNKLEQKLK